MLAVPLIPGQAYHVTGRGVDFRVLASNACHAIELVLLHLEHKAC